MADLRCEIAGVKAPNPFWLASAPPTDKEYNVVRALKAGWGGVVWKTLGEDPPVVNTTSRYGAVQYRGTRMAGFNNIELITDRPLEVNLQEIKRVKRLFPDRAIIVSLMVPCTEESWKAILARVEETECDGVELNFGCPHGMSERGMGSAVGQVPEYIEMVARWCKQHTRMPVFVKLTPNVTNILAPARAARKGGADAVSLINTINSVTAVNLDTMSPEPSVHGKGAHGGYCGPAVKPIALAMVGEIAKDPECQRRPHLRHRRHRDLARRRRVHRHGRRLDPGLHRRHALRLQDRRGHGDRPLQLDGRERLPHPRRLPRRSPPATTSTGASSTSTTRSSPTSTRTCASSAASATSPARTPPTRRSRGCRTNGTRRYEVKPEECVGCNLCMHVCPVEGCITMVEVENGKPYMTWGEDPRNPQNMRVAAE